MLPRYYASKVAMAGHGSLLSKALRSTSPAAAAAVLSGRSNNAWEKISSSTGGGNNYLFSTTTASSTSEDDETRQRTSSSNNSNKSIELFQYQICPFCNKTKAFLNYAGLPYKAIEVNPLTKQEIKWSTDYRKVPMARGPDDEDFTTVWKGSDEIVNVLLEQTWVQERLVAKWNTKSSSTNMTLGEFVDPAEPWIEYTNKELAVLLYPNLCPTWSDSYRAFDYVDSVPTFSSFQRLSIRWAGSLAMYMAASRVKKKHNIDNEREALDKVLQKLVEELSSSGQAFLSKQSEPHLGDLAVYGALRGIEGSRVHTSILQEQPACLKEWYKRMEEKVMQDSQQQ